MQKIYYLLILLLSFSVLSAQEKLSKEEKARREKNIQAGNPFAKYGNKAPVATLSKGKYLEVHDLDTIVIIGTMHWHVDNKKIVGRIIIDSLNVDAQPIGDRVGRWMSPDPLSEEFPSWSPYNYAFNNPVVWIDPTGMAPEPPVNGLDYFRDDTGEYFWDDKKCAYAVHSPTENGSTSFSGEYYTADEFSEPVGNYSIIFDLSNAKPKDEFDKTKTITSISDPLYSFLNIKGEVKNISDPDKYPGVEIYSSPHMNGALTAGNVIFTNPGMEDSGTLAHEYGHYLDYKHHFNYSASDYITSIGLPSIYSATKATLTDSKHHESEPEKRADILGGAYHNTKLYKE